MEKERVFDFSTKKKVSFDTKSYIIRLPSKIVRFLKENGIYVEEIMLDGVWKIEEDFEVRLTFHKEKNTKKEKLDEDDYVILR